MTDLQSLFGDESDESFCSWTTPTAAVQLENPQTPQTLDESSSKINLSQFASLMGTSGEDED